MTDDDWDRVIAVHLRGAFLCARAAQKPMVERKYGRIISLSSVSALGNRGQINYSAAKAGLQGLTRTLAIELGPFGITANAIAPGFIDTDMTRSTAERLGATPEQFQAAWRSHSVATRRPAERGRQRRGVLASDDASYVSGQVIYVDGGPAGIDVEFASGSSVPEKERYMDLGQMLAQTAQRLPDKTAIRFRDQETTYADFDKRANQVANGLIALGVAAGRPCGALAHNLPLFMEAYYGILKAGAAVVPLNVLYKPGEIEYIVKDSGAKALLTLAAFAPRRSRRLPTRRSWRR